LLLAVRSLIYSMVYSRILRSAAWFLFHLLLHPLLLELTRGHDVCHTLTLAVFLFAYMLRASPYLWLCRTPCRQRPSPRPSRCISQYSTLSLTKVTTIPLTRRRPQHVTGPLHSTTPCDLLLAGQLHFTFLFFPFSFLLSLVRYELALALDPAISDHMTTSATSTGHIDNALVHSPRSPASLSTPIAAHSTHIPCHFLFLTLLASNLAKTGLGSPSIANTSSRARPQGWQSRPKHQPFRIRSRCLGIACSFIHLSLVFLL